MKKFTFKLQTVHNVREMRQEQEELVLSELRQELNQAVARLAQLEQMHGDAIKNYSEKLTKGEPLNPFEMELHTSHLVSLDRSIRDAQASVEEKRKACETQSQAVAAANRQVKVTERLRENQQTRHHLELERSEQTAADELVSADYARRILPSK